MANRRLTIAFCGPADRVGPMGTAVTDTAVGLLGEEEGSGCAITVGHGGETSTESVVASNHLVITARSASTTVAIDQPWSDVVIDSVPEAQAIAEQRLVPWVQRWQAGRRAPRAQVATLVDADGSWPGAARRLMARIAAHLHGESVLRIDHIGSTSIEGLAAKDLIDIQVTVPDDKHTVPVANAIVDAGFVHVSGQWHGRDRSGGLHPEQVCVDADPGRPVNINVRSSRRPVARDAVLFRDWLRADTQARDRYLAFKRSLAGRDIDDYGDAKEPFISAALQEAERWAGHTGWAWDLPSRDNPTLWTNSGQTGTSLGGEL